MRFLLIALVTLLLTFIGTAFAADTDADEAAIQSLLMQRDGYFNAQEYEKIVTLFAQDKQATRAALIAKHKDSWKSKKITNSAQGIDSLNIIGDKATATYRYDLNGTPKNERISFIKEQNVWKIEEIRQ